MAKGHFATGTVTGTGSAINVQVGFKPSYVKLLNETDAGTLEWTDSMAAGEGVKLTDVPALSFIGSNGISQYEGTEGADSYGFTIGADADINAASDVIHYIAFGQ